MPLTTTEAVAKVYGNLGELKALVQAVEDGPLLEFANSREQHHWEAAQQTLTDAMHALGRARAALSVPAQPH